MNNDMEKYLGKFTAKNAPPALKAQIISAAKAEWDKKENFFYSFSFLKIYAGLAVFIIICCCFANYYADRNLMKSFKDIHYENKLESSINELFASDEDEQLRKMFQKIAILMKEENRKTNFLDERKKMLSCL